MTDDNNKLGQWDRIPLHRRRVLEGVAGLTTLGIASGSATAAPSEFTVTQGSSSYSITALSNGESIEEFYGYSSFEANTTTDLEQDNTSHLFLWDGPNGLSLVVIHDSGDDNSGGAVTLRFDDLPTDQGEWVVQDEPVEFDSATDTSIDWSWSAGYTDGGAFRGGLGDGFSITIDPAFNDAAEGTPNDPGEITDWQVLSGDPSNPDRISLSLDQTVTIKSEPGTVIAGTVTDQDENAVPNASIKIFTIDDEIVGSATTDDSGRYITEVSVSDDTSTVDIRVSKDGFETKTKQINIEQGETRTVDFTLIPLRPPLAGVKRDLIDDIQAQTGAIIGVDNAQDSIDQEAVAFLDEIESSYADVTTDERQEFDEAVERMVAAEQVTLEAVEEPLRGLTKQTVSTATSIGSGIVTDKLDETIGGNSLRQNAIGFFADLFHSQGKSVNDSVLATGTIGSSTTSDIEGEIRDYQDQILPQLRDEQYANDLQDATEEAINGSYATAVEEIPDPIKDTVRELGTDTDDRLEEILYRWYLRGPKSFIPELPSNSELELPDVDVTIQLPDWIADFPGIDDSFSAEFDPGNIDPLADIPGLDEIDTLLGELDELVQRGVNDAIDTQIQLLRSNISNTDIQMQDDELRLNVRTFSEDAIEFTTEVARNIIDIATDILDFVSDLKENLLIASAILTRAVKYSLGGVIATAKALVIIGKITVILKSIESILIKLSLLTGPVALAVTERIHLASVAGLLNTDLEVVSGS